ncbi:TetR/AcrR family transcriptional regulator [Aquamicrobium terrae]|uniref:AcrR family transcriptional regulator n=1 Tax=Aquamicrobium terrae TaxID=1324945 RepID=A0ABV2MZ29_9HYPH
MSRRKKIDRDRLLDLAESIVRERGAAALTVAALARAAGITNGGVQYSFATKEHLLTAMYDRWAEEYDTKVAALAGDDADRRAILRAQIIVAREEEYDPVTRDRTAVMMAVLMQSPEQLERYRKDCTERLDGLDFTREEDRRLLLALMAMEGAFIMRGFGFMTFRDDAWDALGEEIDKILDESGKNA